MNSWLDWMKAATNTSKQGFVYLQVEGKVQYVVVGDSRRVLQQSSSLRCR